MESSKIQEISMMANTSALCLLGTGKHCIQYSMGDSWSFDQHVHHGNLRVQPCYATHPPSPEIWPYPWITNHHDPSGLVHPQIPMMTGSIFSQKSSPVVKLAPKPSSRYFQVQEGHGPVLVNGNAVRFKHTRGVDMWIWREHKQHM